MRASPQTPSLTCCNYRTNILNIAILEKSLKTILEEHTYTTWMCPERKPCSPPLDTSRRPWAFLKQAFLGLPHASVQGPSSSRRLWAFLKQASMGFPHAGAPGPSSSRRTWAFLMQASKGLPQAGVPGPFSSRRPWAFLKHTSLGLPQAGISIKNLPLAHSRGAITSSGFCS